MPWLQVRIISPREYVNSIENALEQVGALSVAFEDNADQPIFEPALGETPLWHETRVTGLFTADIDTNTTHKALLKQLTEIDSKHIHWHTLEDKDWEREWMTHYHPIQISEDFWLCPSWIEPPAPEAKNLMMDPGLAFGTGTHPTTHLCLRWLSQQQRHTQSILDYGCGSGILGIAALLMGAKHMTGIDIDPQALIATRDNAERNHMSSQQYDVYFPQALPDRRFDIVIANILAGPLVELADTLISQLKPKAALCLSGILASQESAVRQAYEARIAFEPTHYEDEWVCMSGYLKN